MFRSEIFFSTTRVRIFFFCRAKLEFFFQELILDYHYMTKTLNQRYSKAGCQIYIHVIELLCYNIGSCPQVPVIWCVFLLFIDVFLLFVSVLNQLHPVSIYIVYISVLLVVFHMMNETSACVLSLPMFRSEIFFSDYTS
jgi:hypothetical protein